MQTPLSILKQHIVPKISVTPRHIQGDFNIFRHPSRTGRVNRTESKSLNLPFCNLRNLRS